MDVTGCCFCLCLIAIFHTDAFAHRGFSHQGHKAFYTKDTKPLAEQRRLLNIPEIKEMKLLILIHMDVPLKIVYIQRDQQPLQDSCTAESVKIPQAK